MSDVKEECNKIFKQLNEDESGSSEQLVTVSAFKWMWQCLDCTLIQCSFIVHSFKEKLQK